MLNEQKNKIEVLPFVPNRNYRNDALNTDFYEFRMANALFLLGMKDVNLVFDCFFRRNPGPKDKETGYSISAGQEQLTEFLLNYHFDEVACEYLLAKVTEIIIMVIPCGTARSSVEAPEVNIRC